MEIRRFAASGHGLPPFPTGTEKVVTEGLPRGTENHIMGSAVPLWLTRLGIGRWGAGWAVSGGLEMRFRTELFEGHRLVMCIVESDDAIGVEATDEAGTPCVDARVLRTGRPPTATTVGGAPVDDRVPATRESLIGLRLKAVEFEFRADRDLAIVTDLPDSDVWISNRWAHPAWIASSANAMIRRSLDFGWPPTWINAGTEIDLHGAVRDGATVRVEGSVDSLFERGRHSFAVIAMSVTADGTRSASMRYTLIYASNRS